MGAIDEKYDVAISTACGALDNIVVDTMDTAVKCVEFLRKNNLGVATFIGLDKASCGCVFCLAGCDVCKSIELDRTPESQSYWQNGIVSLFVCFFVFKCIFIIVSPQPAASPLSRLFLFLRPEDSVRLFDLVRSKDPAVLTAFYFALRDTLVARDLEQATRIGLQGRIRYRVVTLSGQVVDTAGELQQQ